MARSEALRDRRRRDVRVLVSVVAFDPTGRHVGSGTFDGCAVVIDLAAVIVGIPIADATIMDAIVSPSFVTGLALAADGTLATAGLESTSIHIWDIHSGDLLVEIPADSGEGFPPELAFSPDSHYPLYTDAGNVLRKSFSTQLNRGPSREARHASPSPTIRSRRVGPGDSGVRFMASVQDEDLRASSEPGAVK